MIYYCTGTDMTGAGHLEPQYQHDMPTPNENAAIIYIIKQNVPVPL